MRWDKIFASFKKRHASKPVVSNALDKKLFRHTRGSIWPKSNQFKYLPNFLSRTEKIIINAASTLVVLTLISTLGIFLYSHIETVPQNGGDYTEAILGQPKFVNPIFASTNDIDLDLTTLVYSGLFRYDLENGLQPDLAKEHTLSNDKKTYEIKLHDDVKWSDGEPFTARDVLYTFETIQNPDVGSPLIVSFQGVKIEEVDEKTVRFTLSEPFTPFLSSLTIGILPEHIWGEITPNGMKLAKNNLHTIGTGPWKFSKLIKDDSGNIQSYILVRNENYYNQKPYLERLTFKVFNDYAQAVDALKGQGIDAISFVPRNLQEKITGKSIATYDIRLQQYTALFFNQDQQALLKSPDLRRALALAIDKNKIINEALAGTGTSIHSPILPGNLGFKDDVKKIDLNYEEANALLDKKWSHVQPEEYFKLRQEKLLKNYSEEIKQIQETASSTPEVVSSTLDRINQEIRDIVRREMSKDQSFYRKDKDGNILTLGLTTADTPEYQKVAELIALMWKKLGIQTTITAVSPRSINREILRTREFDILLYGEVLGHDADPYPFWHSSQTDYPGLNLAGFVNRNVDKILEDARTESDNVARGKLYEKFQTIIVDELPAIFLYAPRHTFAANKRIKGITIGEISSPPERYNSLSNWYVKTTWDWK
ncbi:MAG TPA: peptide ABC transporter substrate-binding protein [Patescibacteria group bacterium]|nr:peptide ABC transporter substrate-binding protein [Patescibacteria group bacterium]